MWKRENHQLKEDLLTFKTHSMKYNLIFSGLPESHDRQSENYKQVLKEFISYKDLVIEDNIEFQNVNRLKTTWR